ncbi:MAG TPA: hypothetical protein VLR29_02780 [Flavobacterium sp.]|nr:hypothetical protein [Flavobacterium sp.]
MEIDAVKVEIEKQYQLWKLVPGDLEDFTTAEIYESAVRSMIIDYCEGKGYEVEGFPFQKRILGETDDTYDEDYFCFWRYVKYLDVLATTKDDVLDLLYFYSITFSKDLEISKDDYRKDLLEYIRVNIYYVEF